MPYFDRIAPILVRRLTTELTGLNEFCSFISMAPPGFLKLTLKYTLPRLFAENDAKVLQAVADTVQEKDDSKVGFLVLENSAYILAHVFMLQGVGQTNRSLQLILNLMREDVTNPDQLSLQSVVRSCLVTLLTELVAALGDEDPNTAEAVGTVNRDVLYIVLNFFRRMTGSAKCCGCCKLMTAAPRISSLS